MINKKIEIIANDTLFFKDGKPFSMGEEVWADGIFPPAPSVLYGAIRTAYAFQKYSKSDIPFETAIKLSENLNVKHIFVKLGSDICFPFPLDLIKLKKEVNGRDIFFTEAIEHKSQSSDFKYQLCLPESLKIEKLDEIHGKGFLPKSDFESYLLGIENEIKNSRNLKEFVISEAKVGIGRDDTFKTTTGDAEGKMYRVGMQRTEMWDTDQKLSFIVEFEGLDDFESSGIFRLGAEGKTAKYKPASYTFNPLVN